MSAMDKPIPEAVLSAIRHAADNGGATEGQCYGWWRELTAAQQPAPPSAPVGVEGLVTKWRGLANDALRRSGTWNGNDIADRIEFMADELEAIAQQPAQAAPGDDEFAWREGWAMAYSGADHLYGDDGELQDNRWPNIDWRRDSALEIRHKIEERGNRALAAAQAAARATPPGDDAAGGGHG